MLITLSFNLIENKILKTQLGSVFVLMVCNTTGYGTTGYGTTGVYCHIKH